MKFKKFVVPITLTASVVFGPVSSANATQLPQPFPAHASLVQEQSVSEERSAGATSSLHRVSDDEAPYVVQVNRRGIQVCSGTLISSAWVLTAGECGESELKDLSVNLGSTVRGKGTQIGVSLKSRWAKRDDLVLLKLANPFHGPFGKIGSDELSADTPGQVFGWGKGTPNGPRTVLNAASATGVRESEGGPYYGGRSFQLAGGDHVQIAEVGSPFVANGRVVGVASSRTLDNDGEGRAEPYARVGKVTRWAYVTLLW